MHRLLFILCVLFISCASNKENENIDNTGSTYLEPLKLQGNYLLKEINAEDISSEKIVFKFDTIQKTVTGNAGCNRFSSTFELSEEQIKFSDPVSTKMFCEGKMEMEQKVINILPTISEVNRIKEQVVFYSANNERVLTIQKQD